MPRRPIEAIAPTRRVDSDLAYRHWVGQDATPLVIAVHDLWEHSGYWADFAGALRGRCSLAALDLRGRGRSAAPRAGIALSDHAHDVLALADHLDAPRFLAVGHGFGAATVEMVAVLAPARVQAMVLVDAPADGANIPLASPVGSDFANRDSYFEALRATHSIPRTGLSRAGRTALLDDLVGSGFTWRLRVDRAAVAHDVAALSTWHSPTPNVPAVAIRTITTASQDTPRARGEPEVGHVHVMELDHRGVLFDAAAMDTVADVVTSHCGER